MTDWHAFSQKSFGCLELFLWWSRPEVATTQTVRVERQVEVVSWQQIDAIPNNDSSPLSLCGNSAQRRFKIWKKVVIKGWLQRGAGHHFGTDTVMLAVSHNKHILIQVFILTVLEQTFSPEEASYKQTNKLCPTEREGKIMFTHPQTIWHREMKIFFVVLLDSRKLASNSQSFV